MSDTSTTLPLDDLLAELGVENRHGDENAIIALRRQIDARLEHRAAILAQARLENRDDLRASEDREFRRVSGEVDRLNELLTAHEREFARRAEVDRRMAGVSVRVGHEAGPYRPDGEASYFGDLARRQFQGDSRAAERLARHAAEVERRDLTRTDGSGGEFVPPAYLVAEFAEKARAGRVTADRLNLMPLPPGTDSINIPRVTTGTAVAIQTADNAAVQETDLADANVAAPVRTIAGQSDFALQLLDQSPIAFDRIIFADLLADYAAKLDVQVISGSGSSGQVTGIRNVAGITTVTYTDATPTLPELQKKLADGYQQMSTTRFLSPTSIVMHPRRWAWAMAENDTTNRPLIEATAGSGFNVIGRGAAVAEGQVGILMGLPVYVDANLPTNVGAGTNEDVILMLRGEDAYLFESPIRTRLLADVGSGTLTMRAQIYGYMALAAGRYPASTVVITGTGLVTPTFA